MVKNDLSETVEGESCKVVAYFWYFTEEIGVLIKPSEIHLFCKDVIGCEVRHAWVNCSAEGSFEGWGVNHHRLVDLYADLPLIRVYWVDRDAPVSYLLFSQTWEEGRVDWQSMSSALSIGSYVIFQMNCLVVPVPLDYFM